MKIIYIWSKSIKQIFYLFIMNNDILQTNTWVEF